MDKNDRIPGEYVGDGYYLINKDDMADYTIIQAAMPRPDLPGAVRPTVEPMTPETELKPLDIVMFWDRFSPAPEVQGFNEQA